MNPFAHSSNSSSITLPIDIAVSSMLDELNSSWSITLPSAHLVPTLSSVISNESITGSANGSEPPAPVGGFAESMRVAKLSILAVIFVLILCGNTFVLVALHSRKLKINRMYFFLVHLCYADLITGFFNVLPQLAWEAASRFYGGNFLCKAVKFLQILGPYLSSYILVMTSIDRYQAICHPLAHSATKTTSRSRWMVSAAWFISLLYCSPQLAIFSYEQISEDVYECWGTFPEPWLTQLYVTWYAVSSFIVPFCILTYTHIFICHEIWLNVHSKRQSLMAKEKSCTKAATKESYLVANTSSGLRLADHSLPHSPLPHSKCSRHSLASPSHFFTKSAIGPEPLSSTVNHQVSNKCSRTLNRLLWICHKSSSVSSNSSSVSTSTHSSVSSNACSPCANGHKRSHGRHHHSSPTLNLTTNLCPLHDKASRLRSSDIENRNGLNIHLHQSTGDSAQCTSGQPEGYHLTIGKAINPELCNASQKEVQLEAKVLSSEHATRHEQLMRHAKSESELWLEKQRKQIRRKRRRLQLLDSVETKCSSWSSTSSSSSLTDSSDDSVTTAERKTSTEHGDALSKESSPTNNALHHPHQRHRRYTLSTITSNMLMAQKWHIKQVTDENCDTRVPSNQIYLHQLNCVCAVCRSRCQCSSDIANKSRKLSANSRPVWKVMKPAKAGAKSQSRKDCAAAMNVPTAVMTDYDSQCEHTIHSNYAHLNGSMIRVNGANNNASENNTSLAQLNSSNQHEPSSPNPVYSPVYDFEPVIEAEACSGPRNSITECKSNYPVNKLTHSTSSISAGAGSANVLVPRNYQINRAKQTRLSNPRIHSMQGLTRAKIKTVKITLVVITCYVLCSSPFICVQLWAQWWPGAQETSIWKGPIIAILMLLASLNSCVNPWIYIYFNPNLVSSFCSLFTRKSSSNSNLPSVGGKNSNGGGGPVGNGASGATKRATGNTICGHRTLHKMLTNDSGECSNSMDSRSMRDTSRLDLISAAKETQGGHARSASAHRISQMKSCGTATDISVVTSIDDNNSTVTTFTTAINKLQPVSMYHHHNSHHIHNSVHNQLNSNLSSMSNLNADPDTMTTYESTVTLSTNSTMITAGGSSTLRHQRLSIKSKSSAMSHPCSKVRKPRRRISIQLDKMWNKIATSNKRSTTNSTLVYANSKPPCLTNSDQFIV